ncbi:MAG: sugar-binding protein [Candidatus Brocadiia bacterium]
MSIPRRVPCALALAVASCAPRPEGGAGGPFDVPRLAEVAIDGDGSDWSEGGFRIDVLHDPSPRRASAPDLDATARLGWDPRGLLVLVAVTDDVPFEHTNADQLWRGDSVELFLAPHRGASDHVQVVVAPGADPRQGAPRSRLYDHRKDDALREVEVGVTAACRPRPGGYVLEALLPWEGLGVEPAEGRQVAFQLYVNDADRAGERRQLRWFPEGGAHADSTKLHCVRLAAAPGPPVAAAAWGAYERFRRTRVRVATTADRAGRMARVLAGGRELGRARLVADGRLATARVALPMPPRGEPYGPLDVVVGDRVVAAVRLPDPDAARQRAFEEEALGFRPSVFAGEEFPEVVFEHPSRVEDLIGPYTLAATFYDAAYQEVAAAQAPGRYGAIVEVRPDRGPTTFRFLTLFGLPRRVDWRRTQLRATVRLPEEMGIEPRVVDRWSESVGEYLKWEVRSSFDRNPESAVLFAGLYELEPDTPVTDRTSPWTRDVWWWHGLKKKTGHLKPLRYLVHLPPGAEEGEGRTWPAILFLHGAGERGDDLSLVETHGPPKIVKTREDFPFIVVAPQCPRGQWWSPPLLDDLYREVMAKYPVDPERVYLTGLSMGGFGSWALACEFPDRFAAVAPICGGGDPRDAQRIAEVPIWVFHGAQDGVVPVERSEQMVAALRRAGGRVRLTVYPEAGHDSWSKAYASEELYEWLLCQRRGEPRQPRAPERGP